MTDEERALIARNSPATDLLESHLLFDEAEVLRKAPRKSVLLELTIPLLEDQIRLRMSLDVQGDMAPWSRQVIAIIAEHRGETPEFTLLRLRPPVTQWATEPTRFTLTGPPAGTATAKVSPSGQSVTFTYSDPPPETPYDVYDGDLLIAHVRSRPFVGDQVSMAEIRAEIAREPLPDFSPGDPVYETLPSEDMP